MNYECISVPYVQQKRETRANDTDKSVGCVYDRNAADAVPPQKPSQALNGRFRRNSNHVGRHHV
jgi:hypothetical protein